MSALGLPELRRDILARYRALRRAHWRRLAVRTAIWWCFGVAIGFNVEPALRAILEGPRDTVHATAEERRALDRLRAVNVRLVSNLSADELRGRLEMSTEALALAALFDKLPDSRSPGSHRWLIGTSTGRLGRPEAIALLGRFIAEQPLTRRAEIATLLALLGAALPSSAEFVQWVAELPEDARTPGRLAALRQLAAFPEPSLQRLATIAATYSGPGDQYRDAPPPYPCIDPVSNTRWFRDRKPLFTCTVAIQ